MVRVGLAMSARRCPPQPKATIARVSHARLCIFSTTWLAALRPRPSPRVTQARPFGYWRGPPSHHRDLDVVDGRQRIEQAAPLLAPVASHPELTGRRSEVERGRLQLVDVHRVALDGEEALLLGEAARQTLPGVAAILAAPHRGCAARTGTRHRLEREHVGGVGIVRMHDDGEAEIGRKSFGDRPPGVTVVVAAQHADAGPLGEASMVLQVEPTRDGGVPGDLVDALAVLRERVGREADADAFVRGSESPAAILAQIVSARRDTQVDAISVAQDGVQAESAVSWLPLARVLVVADPRHELPGVAAVAALEERGGLDAAQQILLVASRLERPDVDERAPVVLGEGRRRGRLRAGLSQIGRAHDLHSEERAAARGVEGRRAAR